MKLTRKLLYGFSLLWEKAPEGLIYIPSKAQEINWKCRSLWFYLLALVGTDKYKWMLVFIANRAGGSLGNIYRSGFINICRYIILKQNWRISSSPLNVHVKRGCLPWRPLPQFLQTLTLLKRCLETAEAIELPSSVLLPLRSTSFTRSAIQRKRICAYMDMPVDHGKLTCLLKKSHQSFENQL